MLSSIYAEHIWRIEFGNRWWTGECPTIFKKQSFEEE